MRTQDHGLVKNISLDLQFGLYLYTFVERFDLKQYGMYHRTVAHSWFLGELSSRPRVQSWYQPAKFYKIQEIWCSMRPVFSDTQLFSSVSKF